MDIILVGQTDGRRVICWTNAIMLWLGLSMLMALGILGLYWLLSGAWSMRAATMGIFFPSLLVGLGITVGLKTPVNKLREAR